MTYLVPLVSLGLSFMAILISVASVIYTRRTAAAQRDSATVEMHRRHDEAGPAALRLEDVDVNDDNELYATLVNPTHRSYTYLGWIEYEDGVRDSIEPGELLGDDRLPVQVGRGGEAAKLLELWLDGGCPCKRPDGRHGHWKRTLTVPDRLIHPIVA